MASHVYKKVKNFSLGLRLRIEFHHQRHLEPFSPARLLEFVSIEMLGKCTKNQERKAISGNNNGQIEQAHYGETDYNTHINAVRVHYL